MAQTFKLHSRALLLCAAGAAVAQSQNAAAKDNEPAYPT